MPTSVSNPKKTAGPGSGRGGARPGAGRKKGGRNRLSEESLKTAKQMGVTPLEFLLRVIADDSEDMGRRVDAAKAAAPYVHPRLTAVTVSGDLTINHEQALKELE